MVPLETRSSVSVVVLVPIRKELVTDEWLKAFDLGSQFWEHSWKGIAGKKNYLSLKKDIQDILDGKVSLANELVKRKYPSKISRKYPWVFSAKTGQKYLNFNGEYVKA